VARAAATAVGPGSFALDLGLVEFQGEPWSDESNGQRVVAIVRDGKLITMMFRRLTQPWTPEALRVDNVRKL
jgi:hypothetical protein